MNDTESWLQAWDSQGFHRTGTLGDHAGADWLTSAAQSLGASVTQETFLLDRLDPGDTYLEIDGVRIPGVPVFDAPATAGITGVLGKEITVTALAPGGGLHRRIPAAAGGCGARRVGNRVPGVGPAER